MVHVFHYKEHYYIFDTGSSSLHECDEKGALLMREKLGEAVDTSSVSETERKEYEADFAATTATCAAATVLRTRVRITQSANL